VTVVDDVLLSVGKQSWSSGNVTTQVTEEGDILLVRCSQGSVLEGSQRAQLLQFVEGWKSAGESMDDTIFSIWGHGRIIFENDVTTRICVAIDASSGRYFIWVKEATCVVHREGSGMTISFYDTSHYLNTRPQKKILSSPAPVPKTALVATIAIASLYVFWSLLRLLAIFRTRSTLARHMREKLPQHLSESHS